MASEQDIRALPNGSRFYRADLHIHSYGASHDLSDAKMTPQGIVQTAIEQNLHLIAITPFVERATRLPVSVLLITCKRPGSCIPTELRAWRRSCWDGRRGPGGVSQAGGLRPEGVGVMPWGRSGLTEVWVIEGRTDRSADDLRGWPWFVALRQAPEREARSSPP
jgi:hypothetical protein